MSDFNLRVVLANGYVHEGFDERSPDDILATLAPGYQFDELEDGWTWIAGLYVKPADVDALVIIPEVP